MISFADKKSVAEVCDPPRCVPVGGVVRAGAEIKGGVRAGAGRERAGKAEGRRGHRR